MVPKWKGVTFDISFWKGEAVRLGAVLGTWIRKLCLGASGRSPQPNRPNDVAQVYTYWPPSQFSLYFKIEYMEHLKHPGHPEHPSLQWKTICQKETKTEKNYDEADKPHQRWLASGCNNPSGHAKGCNTSPSQRLPF